MRTMSRISAASPVRAAYRVPTSVVALGVLALGGALATWGGVSLRIVLPAAAAVLAIVLFVAARRALRAAGARIDTILSEELGPPPESPVRPGAEVETREHEADHGGRADAACPIPRARMDDAQLGGRRRK